MRYEAENEIIDVPVRPNIKRIKRDKYGGVPGMYKSEMADPDELERLAYKRFFEPVLTLPVKGDMWSELSDMDSAFNTHDFDRECPDRKFRRMIDKKQKLIDKLESSLITLSIVKQRLTKAVREEIILAVQNSRPYQSEIDDAEAFYRLYRRAIGLRKEAFGR